MLQLNKAYIAALLYAFIIGFSFMFVKIALTVATPLDTLAHRFSISFLAIFIFFLIKKIRFSIKFKDILAILPLALFYPALFFSFQAFGLLYTSSSEAGIIQATVPIFTLALATYFLKEHSTLWQQIFTCLSVAGVIYIFMMKGFSPELTNTRGILLILLSTLSAACYNVLARNLTQRYSLVILTYIMSLLGMLLFNGMAIVQHINNHTLMYYFTSFLNKDFLIATLYLGLFSSLGTSFLSNYALSKMEASKMSVFNNFATLVTILAGVFYLGEKLESYHFIGGAVIVIGVIGANFRTKAKKKV
ncbi:MAG: protein of unknown function transrane [Firmicutes bacterium]|nr:protein of unknown function transrane [Bacillota bacterium]